MIQIKDKSACCGCSACYAICPKQCITLSADKEGFLYPVVNAEVCINCGLCEKVCPVLHPKKKKTEPEVFAVINTDEKIRLQSSSGGIFTFIAEKVIDEGGVVFGARFNENWEVVHDYTETKEGLSYFRGSKYVQSNLGNIFNQAKSFLGAGRKVMFTGTPCQIAGLKNFLRKSYDNLLAVDVICHGVPSPTVWKGYLSQSVKNIYKNQPLSKGTLKLKDVIQNINFRSKENGWKNYHVAIEYKNGERESTSFYQNMYMNAFLSDFSLRPSCFACPAKLDNMQGDITLADCWGVDKLKPEIDDDKGCGLMLIHNPIIWKQYDEVSSIVKYPLDLSDVVKYNPMIMASATMPVNRTLFFDLLSKIGLKKTYQYTTSSRLLIRILRNLYRRLK